MNPSPNSEPPKVIDRNNFYYQSAKWWILIAVGTSTFMSALDGSVVNTILPVINRNLGSGIAAVEWVVITYLLVLSGLLLSFGRLGDLRGHKKIFIVGLVTFIVGSTLCGFSVSITTLVLFRGIQAVGAAMVQANSPAIITKNFPGSQRGQALGTVATMTYLGLTIGPFFGGWLTQQFSWRAVFFINIPIGLFVLWLSNHHIPVHKPSQPTRIFDFPGALTFTTGLVVLMLALNQGHSLGWSSPMIIALFLCSVLLFGTFVYIEQRSTSPMISLNLFKNRTFSASTLSAIFNYFCIYGILFLVPFYLIQGRNLSPAQAGLLLTMQPIIMAILAPISGTLSDRIGTRYLTVSGMLLLALGLVLLSGLDNQTTKFQITLALGVVGLGTGIFISPNTSALMGSAPKHRQGTAAGILATSRNLGMVLGVGLAGAIFTTVLSEFDETAAINLTLKINFIVTAGVALLGAIIAATTKKGI